MMGTHLTVVLKMLESNRSPLLLVTKPLMNSHTLSHRPKEAHTRQRSAVGITPPST